MRALVRVLPLLVAAALVAACATNDMARENSGTARAAAAANRTAAANKAARERPDPALLARQPSPQCERTKPLEGVPPEQARAAMLDYEQQCYRQLADIAHARLSALQDVAERTPSIQPRHKALLERQPAPHCEPAKASAGASAAEGREAVLDAQRQCYKQIEASERSRLDRLQDALRQPDRTSRNRLHGARSERYLRY